MLEVLRSAIVVLFVRNALLRVKNYIYRQMSMIVPQMYSFMLLGRGRSSYDKRIVPEQDTTNRYPPPGWQLTNKTHFTHGLRAHVLHAQEINNLKVVNTHKLICWHPPLKRVHELWHVGVSHSKKTIGRCRFSHGPRVACGSRKASARFICRLCEQRQ